MSETAAEHPAAGAPAPEAASASVRAGAGFAFAAYGIWGVFPLYIKLIDHVPALEILLHRALWALPAVGLILALRGAWAGALAALKRPRTRGVLALTALVISLNWLLWTYAVTSGQVLQSALGYFINPLVSVALGMIVLRERLSPIQGLAAALAATGVAVLTFASGAPPWIALALAFSFGIYGLLRKQVNADAATGVFIETLYLAPLCVAGLIWLSTTGRAVAPEAGWGTLALLALAGPVTATPLLLFALAARRLKLATLGLMQYIAPTGHFIIAMAYDEPFTLAHGVTFALIWTGLAIFTADALARERRAARARRAVRSARTPEYVDG